MLEVPDQNSPRHDGHTGSMTWKLGTLLSLFVFLSTIDLSKEDCIDYFNMEKWGPNLTDIISLVKTKNYKDTIECTVERQVVENDTMRHILYHCYKREKRVQNVTEKCEGDRMNASVHFYHFMCLVAKDFNYTPAGCDYATACQLYSERTSTVLDQTTPATTTVMQPPATTITPPATTTALPLAATVTQSAANGSNGQSSTVADVKKDTFTLTLILVISLVLNVVLVAFYLYERGGRKQSNPTSVLCKCAASSGAQPLMGMEETRPLSNVQVDIKGKPHSLIQEYITSHSITIPSADSVLL